MFYYMIVFYFYCFFVLLLVIFIFAASCFVSAATCFLLHFCFASKFSPLTLQLHLVNIFYSLSIYSFLYFQSSVGVNYCDLYFPLTILF